MIVNSHKLQENIHNNLCNLIQFVLIYMQIVFYETENIF